MSEEEKKAINILELFEPDDLSECALYRNALETILNLIEKQQKEYEQEKEKNKELEDITRAYDAMKGIMPEGTPIIIANQEYFDSGRFVERYISKDKIKELQCQLCMQLGSYVRNEATPEQERIAGGINILNRLLEEV